MNLDFCSFASGSSGNCYLIKYGEDAVLIDAGISTKRIHNSLKEMGVDRDCVRGVFLTHEHSDHVKALPVLTKQNPQWRVFASFGTGRHVGDKLYDDSVLETLSAGECADIGGMRISSFRVSHDAAEPVCYKITAGGSSIMIVTDTGFVSEQLMDQMTDTDVVILEANHEVNMLKMGPYPYPLKRRILGDQGHLSNETAGNVLAEIMRRDDRYRRIYLAHLSKENNFPDLAEQTVRNILEDHRFFAGRHLELQVMKRDEISGITRL